ncbi:MAG: hypothetical protein U9N35_08080, partial [Euryarchaeota archaeon]|nr:hypothetical protein [Euryarchaeota archaeon]
DAYPIFYEDMVRDVSNLRLEPFHRPVEAVAALRPAPVPAGPAPDAYPIFYEDMVRDVSNLRLEPFHRPVEGMIQPEVRLIFTSYGKNCRTA